MLCEFGPVYGSPLQRLALLWINFSNVSPMCLTNDGVEDTEHFLLLCQSFAVQ